jgi:hypothetical protein
LIDRLTNSRFYRYTTEVQALFDTRDTGVARNDNPLRDIDPATIDPAWLLNELKEAHQTIRALLRQLSKEQGRHAEIARAYNKTVANLVEITRENAALERERDMWKARAESSMREQAAAKIGNLPFSLTAAEISAIRKAMARLHHPDAGGDAERMKLWNAALDPLEEQVSS